MRTSRILPLSALLAALASPGAHAWKASSPEAAAFYNDIARAKVGRTLECAGDWNKKEDPIGVIGLHCEGLTLPFNHPWNYVHLNAYLLNGWEVTARQIVPGESPNWPKVLVTLRKISVKPVYSDAALGPMEN